MIQDTSDTVVEKLQELSRNSIPQLDRILRMGALAHNPYGVIHRLGGWMEDHTTLERSSICDTGVSGPPHFERYGPSYVFKVIGDSEGMLLAGQLAELAKQAGIEAFADSHYVDKHKRLDWMVVLKADSVTSERLDRFNELLWDKVKALMDDVAIHSVDMRLRPAGEPDARAVNLEFLQRFVNQLERLNTTDRESISHHLERMIRTHESLEVG